MLKSCVFLSGNVATLAKQIRLRVLEELAWMYGCYHGDRLVVRSLGDRCRIGMCQTDRGVRTHAHTDTHQTKKPAASPKSIRDLNQASYKILQF